MYRFPPTPHPLSHPGGIPDRVPVRTSRWTTWRKGAPLSNKTDINQRDRQTDQDELQCNFRFQTPSLDRRKLQEVVPFSWVWLRLNSYYGPFFFFFVVIASLSRRRQVPLDIQTLRLVPKILQHKHAHKRREPPGLQRSSFQKINWLSGRCNFRKLYITVPTPKYANYFSADKILFVNTRASGKCKRKRLLFVRFKIN